MLEIITEAELLEANKIKFTGPKHIERIQNGKKISYTVWYVNGEPVSHQEYKVHHQRMKHLGAETPSPSEEFHRNQAEIDKLQAEIDIRTKAQSKNVRDRIKKFDEEIKNFENNVMTPEQIEKRLRRSLSKVMNRKIEDRVRLKASKLDEPEYQALLNTFPPGFENDRKQLEKLNAEMDRVLEKKYGTSDLSKIYDVDIKRATEISNEFVKALRPGISKYFTEICLKAAINRGYDPKTAMDTAYWLAFADLGYKATASEFVSSQAQDKLRGEIGEPLGRLLGSASRNLPIAQIGYLLYSGILSPIATLRAVRDVTLGMHGKDVLPTRTLVGTSISPRSGKMLGMPVGYGGLYGNEIGAFGMFPEKVKYGKKSPKQIIRERYTPLIMELTNKGYGSRHIAGVISKETEPLGLGRISHQFVRNVVNDVVKGKTHLDVAGEVGDSSSAQSFNQTEYDESVDYVNKRLRQDMGGDRFEDGSKVDFRNPLLFNSFVNAYINDIPVGNQLGVNIPEMPMPIKLRVEELGMAVRRTIGLHEDKSRLQTFNELEAAKRQVGQFNMAVQRIDSDIRKSGRVSPDAVFNFINHNRAEFYNDLMQAMNSSNAVDADVWLHINGQPVPVSRAATAKILSMHQKIQSLNNLNATLEPYKDEMIQNGRMYGHTEPTTMEIWPALKDALISSSPGQSTIEVRLPGVGHLVPFDRDEVRNALSLGNIEVKESFDWFEEKITRVHGTSNGSLVEKRLINEHLVDWNSMLEKARARKLKVKK